MKRRLLIAFLFVAVVAMVLVGQHLITTHRLSYQGRQVREWAAQLHATYEPRNTNAAAVAFHAMGAKAVPALRPLVHLRDPLYEKALLKYARRIPARPRTYLFQKLQPGRTIEYRLGAIRALGVLGPTATAALPELLAALGDADGRIRWTTAQPIHQLGPEAITALIPLTTHADSNVRHATVYALGEARTNALPAVPALIRCSMDPNESVRASALYSLSRVGLAAMPQVLEIAATENDPELQGAAFRSLVALRPQFGRVMPSFLTISTNTPEVRRLALLSLWMSRQTNRAAVKLYQGGLNDADASVRETAQKILERLDSTNRNRLGPL